ncbi:dihydroorotase [Ferruginivarius sediminum]|uniref:Dihydroorotase n=1 Tax=Ferruginivarius sediminum TaxID=2661937 RepID=A0A369TEY0_9PROT|nr:dihydroorotase [Ferruginivarius sediminum]RDD61476.1 dihydroorotase [Ferruginivarius sediminum]
MTDTYDLLIRGGTVVTPWGAETCDLGVRDDLIAALGDLGGASAGETVDAAGLHVLPGVIDSQVHFREPGLDHKEDLESGTRAAILGGVTSIFEMPNTKPPTVTPEALRDKLDRARGRAWCDHAFFVGGSPDNADELAEMERLPGCAGIKVFMGSSTGTLLVEDEETLAIVASSVRRRFAVHAEDEARLRERLGIARDSGDVRDHPNWRDVEAAVLATTRIVQLCRRYGGRVQVLHVSTAEEMEVLAAYKDVATVEVTPQHLTLAAPECYERFGTHAQMNPPIRDARHREGLWRALSQGIVDVIGSDHAPHSAEEKERAYPTSPSGIPGVQTLLPIMLNHVAEGRLSLQRLVELTAHGPARVYNVARKGRVAVGFDADLTLVDLKARREITLDWLASKSGWSPFAGMQVTGWPVATVLRGQPVARDGELQGKPAGEPVRFLECLPPEAA